MSDGSIKPSVGTAKTTRSAISKVTGEAQASNEKNTPISTLFQDGSKLAALRPGSLVEEINNQKKDSENSENKNDKGEVAKSDKNDSRTYTNSRESENQAIINKIWGKNGALTGLKSNNVNGAADIGSYTSLSGGSALSSPSSAGLSGNSSSKGGTGLTSSSATSLDGGSNGVPLTRTGGEGGSTGGGSGGGGTGGGGSIQQSQNLGSGGSRGDGGSSGGNVNFGSSRGVNENGLSKTLSNGELGAKIHNQPSDSGLDKLEWTRASMRGGRFYENGEQLAEAIKSFVGGDKVMQKNAVFMATNKLSKEDFQSGKLDFLKQDQNFIENGKRLEYQKGAGQQYHDEVSKINKEEFSKLAQASGHDSVGLQKTLSKYGIEDMANFSGRAFYNAGKDSELLGSVDKTYDVVRSMYDKYGTIPNVTTSLDWFTSPRGDDTAFARSLRGMNLGQQSELKYQGLSAGGNNTIHMHLMTQGTENHFMQFDKNGELSGGLMKDFNTWKTNTFVKAVEKLIQEEKDKGNDVSKLSADPAKVTGVFSRISGHGSAHKDLAGLDADQAGTSMESGVMSEDKNQFARDDAADIAKVFKENFAEAELCMHEQSTCFGGSNALESVLDAIDDVTKGQVFGSGPKLEGLVTVDNMAKDGDNQYSTMLKLSDDTPLAVEIDRNGEDVNSRGEKNGDIDLVKGEEANVDKLAIEERQKQIEDHQSGKTEAKAEDIAKNSDSNSKAPEEEKPEEKVA